MTPPAPTAHPTDTAAAVAEVLGAVHSWDLSSNVDGPGTRFVAFLAGCPLRCLYCHNPDTWSSATGTPTTAGELLARIERYRRFIEVAGGGVTLSGGEPLLQPRFVEAVLQGCRERGLHTALDTCGVTGDRTPDGLLDLVDLVLLDIKSWGASRYRELTGGELEPTLRFARRLGARGQRTWLRYVVVPGHTDLDEVVDGVAGFAASLGCVERVDVLPFLRLGLDKYEALGIPYPLPDVPSPDEATLARVRERFERHGLTAV